MAWYKAEPCTIREPDGRQRLNHNCILKNRYTRHPSVWHGHAAVELTETERIVAALEGKLREDPMYGKHH